MASPAPELLAALAAKYRELRSLRLAAAAGDAAPPRARLAALARRHPGALREIDRLPLEVIEARLSALELAAGGEAPAPAWAALQLAYHGWLRVLLRLKPVVPRDQPAEQAAAALRAAYAPAPDEPPPAALDAAVVEALRAPPGGRMSLWVLSRVAADHGVEAIQVEAALFDFPP